VEGGERILIVRLSAAGDTVHSLHLAAAVRKALPNCYLGWLAEDGPGPLIRENPLLNWWKTVPKGFLKSPGAVFRLYKELKAERFAASLDPQSISKSAIPAFLSRAPVRAGFARPEGREIAPLLNNTLIKPESRHVVWKTLELMAAIGLKPPAEVPELVFPKLKDPDLSALDGFFAEKGLKEKGFFVFAPGSAQLSKRWPLPRFAELAERLLRRTGKPCVFAAHGEDDRMGVARETAAAGLQESAFLAPDMSVLGVVELIRRSYLFVGPDSFAGHAAAGLRVPSVMLFSVSDPLRVGPLSGLGASVFNKLTIARSARARRRLTQENMESLGVEAVEEAVLGVMEKTAAGGFEKPKGANDPEKA
jgi:heptosyltransferase-1